MNLVAMLLALMVPAASFAATKVLLFEDIGSESAYFAWNKASGNRAALSATVNHWPCSVEDCYDYRSTGALKGFERAGREVFYIGPAGETPILCGRTYGLFTRSQFLPTCRISVETAHVCESWYTADDCAHAVTRYRVYLVIDEGAANATRSVSSE